jgi:hypothetical protein
MCGRCKYAVLVSHLVAQLLQLMSHLLAEKLLYEFDGLLRLLRLLVQSDQAPCPRVQHPALIEVLFQL